MKENIRSLLSYSSLGIEMGLSVAIGIGMGFFLDKVFRTFPYLTVIFLIFGVVSGFRTVYRVIKRVEKESSEGRDS
ncbi:MAG: AtpZ/AtpI family protein [Desulfobacterota bacterium]|nr:AtpZ/AtpI family protein [Thermodesulfobacteriota bacterium]MDW8002601.1 AtpZ/AtpI family protein [Deltaproteobacteria bacterium]